jgi:hypothetical protein
MAAMRHVAADYERQLPRGTPARRAAARAVRSPTRPMHGPALQDPHPSPASILPRHNLSTARALRGARRGARVLVGGLRRLSGWPRNSARQNETTTAGFTGFFEVGVGDTFWKSRTKKEGSFRRVLRRYLRALRGRVVPMAGE